jgi:hypothetical protein
VPRPLCGQNRRYDRNCWCTSNPFLLHMSSVGDGKDNNNNNNNNGNGGPLDDFLDPARGKESDNLKRVREALSEESLPISFDKDKNNNEASTGAGATLDGVTQENNDNEIEDVDDASSEEEKKDEQPASPSMNDGGKMIGAFSTSAEETDLLLQNNPYLAVVAKLSPSDLIRKFTASAHPRVQDAVRATVLGLIGNLPKMAFETTTVTTGERLASLMFQLQMTGYMFKNAEYRLSMSQSLGIDIADADINNYKNSNTNKYLLTGEDLEHEEDDLPLSVGDVKGKIKVSYGGTSSNSSDGSKDVDENTTEEKVEDDKMEMEVDAAAYMSELRDQVQNLRDELEQKRKENEEEIRKDLLRYIRTLPKQQLDSLTNTMSQDVLKSMKGLVNVVMTGIGEGKIGPETITEQTGEAMAQLCMWQLVVGYNLRELEVREEMKQALLSGSSTTSAEQVDDDEEDDTNSVIFDAGGFE